MTLTLRVYGILINEQQQVLVSDEIIRGNFYTKFPGGGLEIGEGTRDCLKREFMEEMGLRVEVGDHLYTTDYYQVSAFNHNDQIISIYYHVKPLEAVNLDTNSEEVFRFIDWEEFGVESVTLPIDKIVAHMIKNTSHKLTFGA